MPMKDETLEEIKELASSTDIHAYVFNWSNVYNKMWILDTLRLIAETGVSYTNRFELRLIKRILKSSGIKFTVRHEWAEGLKAFVWSYWEIES